MKALDRYRVLVETAARSGTLWALMSEGAFVTYADPRGHVVVALWRDRDSAAAMATGNWRDAVPTSVPVKAFFEWELDPMDADGVQITTYPTRTSSGAAVRAALFGRALREAQGDQQ